MPQLVNYLPEKQKTRCRQIKTIYRIDILYSIALIVFYGRQDRRNTRHCRLFILVHDLGVYLCGRKQTVTEQLAYGVDVRPEVEHHGCKGMPPAVK